MNTLHGKQEGAAKTSSYSSPFLSDVVKRARIGLIYNCANIQKVTTHKELAPNKSFYTYSFLCEWALSLVLALHVRTSAT